MIWEIKIEDAAINRYEPSVLKRLIEAECMDLENTIIRQINQGRKKMGLEVMELGSSEQSIEVEQGSGDQ